uniref:Secreted protein n=1 Tax=Trichogramma kaykai TaxID=54128 RepID=A0ABD2W6J2_9HYME
MSHRILSAGKIGESKAVTCIIIAMICSSTLSPTARKVGNWLYRLHKGKESCMTLTMSRAPVIWVSRKPSIASRASTIGVACITTYTNTFARVIHANATRLTRRVRVDLWGVESSSGRGP